MFDTSSSMAGDRIEALRAAGEAFLDGLRPADEAGLVAFSEDVFWLADPTSDKAAVRRALSRLRAEGATSVYDALYAAITLSEGELRPLIVLFTDGEDNTSWLGDADLRIVVQRSNALVHVVGWRPPLSPEARRKLPHGVGAGTCAARDRRGGRGPLLGRRLAGAAAAGVRARSPTRWAIGTCCATSLPGSPARAGIRSTHGCAASRATSTCAAATGSRLS